MKSRACVAGLCALLLGLSVHAAPTNDASPAAVAIIDAIAMDQDPRVAAALARIHGTDRRLLALRAYLRAGPGLGERWSWTDEQIATFAHSAENEAMQAEIEKVRRAFSAANPGFELWVNPQVRSLDIQLGNWNHNDSVARAAARLLDAFGKWQQSAVRMMPAADVPAAAGKFLTGFVPSPTPTLAAPGLSPHGQMRAIDFHVRQGERTVAGPSSARIATDWDAAGWAAKLATAVRTGSSHFTGPLQMPREPWHFIYAP